MIMKKNKSKFNILGGIIRTFGVLLLTLFLIPLSRKSSLHVGNITGILVSLFLIYRGAKFSEINETISEWKKDSQKKYIVYGFRTVVMAIFVVVIGMTSLMVKSCSNYPSQNQTAIVLGCRVYGNTPSLSLKSRLDAAYEYLIDNPNAKCVVSGGQGPNEIMTEAESMYNYLVDKGISPDRIFKEDKSTSTRENIKFSLEVIEKENLPKEIAIVTNEYHQYRASKVAEKLGITPTAIPAKTPWWLFPTMYTRELYGILYEMII